MYTPICLMAQIRIIYKICSRVPTKKEGDLNRRINN